jgi:predicted nucleic acid-binding protein
MKTYLLDSDVLIDFFKRKQEAVALVEELGGMGQLALSALSVAELRSGWTEQDAGIYLPRLYDLALVIPVSDKVAEQAGTYREVYRRKGIVLPTIDALIAATALFYSYCLVTRNKKDYPLPELDLYPMS